MVVDGGLVDGNARGGANVKRVGVVAAVGDITGLVVDCDGVEEQVLAVVDAETLDGGVEDV